jgi:hypothetical protein
MDWQQITSLFIVVGTIALLAWRQSRSGKSSAQSGCGCGHSCGMLPQTHTATARTQEQTDPAQKFVKNF